MMRSLGGMVGTVALGAALSGVATAMEPLGGMDREEVVKGQVRLHPESGKAVAFLLVTEVMDASSGFESRLKDLMSKGDVTNRASSGGFVEFRLGCFYGGRLVDDQGKEVLSVEQTASLLGRSYKDPATVVFHFKEAGRDGLCGSFADHIEVQATTDTVK